MPSSANDLKKKLTERTIVKKYFFINENLGDKPTQKGVSKN